MIQLSKTAEQLFVDLSHAIIPNERNPRPDDTLCGMIDYELKCMSALGKVREEPGRGGIRRGSLIILHNNVVEGVISLSNAGYADYARRYANRLKRIQTKY